MKLVAPHNRRRFKVIVIGTGLAGGAAAATLGELGYDVHAFTFHDSPRRAHSIAAQGGINAAKNYKGDGDSIFRLFYDTVKGGDFRAREGNVYRLAQLSVDIIDQCVAQGVPFAREYGGLLDNRSFGGAQVSRTFYARGQTGQQLLLGAYQALAQQIGNGNVTIYPRSEMLELVVKDGRACGIVARHLHTGEVKSYSAHAVILATGGYGNAFYLSTNAKASNATAIWRAHRKGAVRQPVLHPDPSDVHPGERRLPVEAHAHVRVVAQRRRVWVPMKTDDPRSPDQIPEAERDYFLERRYPPSATSCRATSRRAIKVEVDKGRGVGPLKNGVYLDFSESIKRLGEDTIRERYDNLFQMYDRITGEDPYKVPMRIYPAVHYVMGGLWVDYDLQSTIPGCFVAGEANFSDHGANRLGALGPHAGSFRRLLRVAVHRAELPRRHAWPGACTYRRSGIRRRRSRRARAHRQVHVDEGHAVGRPLPPRARQDHVGLLRDGAIEGEPREGPLGDPRVARGVREGPAHSRHRGLTEPVAREGRPRRRLLRARRAHVS